MYIFVTYVYCTEHVGHPVFTREYAPSCIMVRCQKVSKHLFLELDVSKNDLCMQGIRLVTFIPYTLVACKAGPYYSILDESGFILSALAVDQV